MKMKHLDCLFLTLTLVLSSCSNSKGFGKKRYTTNSYSKPK